MDEAADFVEVVRRLWDSWEDDAEIRDVATGRFIDRDKLHYIDFEGPRFSVRGPSITPRPPKASRSSVCWRTSMQRSASRLDLRMWSLSRPIRARAPGPGCRCPPARGRRR